MASLGVMMTSHTNFRKGPRSCTDKMAGIIVSSATHLSLADNQVAAYNFAAQEVHMSDIGKLEDQVKKLSPKELAEFRAWFAEFDAQVWDRQIEADSAAGKLDHLIQEAVADYKAGKSRPL